MIRPLTARQQQVLAVVMLSMDVHRCVPSIRRLCEMVGKSSTDTVYRTLLILLDKGYLTRPVVRRGLFVPTAKADAWWSEFKKPILPESTEQERAEIWRADRAIVGEVGG